MHNLSNQTGLNFIYLKSFKWIVYKELFAEITLRRKLNNIIRTMFLQIQCANRKWGKTFSMNNSLPSSENPVLKLTYTPTLFIFLRSWGEHNLSAGEVCKQVTKDMYVHTETTSKPRNTSLKMFKQLQPHSVRIHISQTFSCLNVSNIHIY